MKIIAVSDIHGRPLEGLKRMLEKEKPDIVAFLGDYDRVETIREIMEISGQQKSIVLPGNHEHAIYNGLLITSPALREQGKSSDELSDELCADMKARAFVGRLLDNYKEEIIIQGPSGNKYRTLFIHGALDGSLISNPCATEEAFLWFRLLSEHDHMLNFREMEKRGYKIMIRGHDPVQHYAYLDRKEGVVLLEGENKYPLLPDRLHTITAGEYLKGCYAVIDTTPAENTFPVVSLRKEK